MLNGNMDIDMALVNFDESSIQGDNTTFILKTLVNQLNAVSSAISKLKTSLETDLNDIKKKLVHYETSVEYIGLKINENSQKIGVLETKVANLEYDLITVKHTVEDIKTIKQTIQEISNKIGSVSSKSDKTVIILGLWDKLFWLVVATGISVAAGVFAVRFK